MNAIDVVARRFKFEPSRIVVTQGNLVRLTIVSADVTHGFAIKQYHVDVDVPAGGEPVTVEFVATEPGTFDIVCSEYCGDGHRGMHATLVVEPPAAAHEPEPDLSGPSAQPDPPVSPSPAAPQLNPIDAQDQSIKPAEPDFTLVDLPTTLRLPRFKSAIRVTHRFAQPVNQGSFGSLASSLFGLDSGAQIGIEYRFGLARGAQIGIHRTSNRTIEFFGQYDLLRRARPGPLALDALVSVEGLNNFRQDYSPGLGLVASHRLGARGAVYAVPMWVGNTNPQAGPAELRHTFFVGLGARLRVRPTVYVVGEVSPRVAGFRPSDAAASLGIEKRVGGHVFQLNASNGFGTTAGQIARGGRNGHEWAIGFNITRKIY